MNRFTGGFIFKLLISLQLVFLAFYAVFRKILLPEDCVKC